MSAPLRLQSVSVTAMQIAVTSLSGHGPRRAGPVGVFVKTASTILQDAGASAVAMATTASHRCPSAPHTSAHVSTQGPQ